MYNILFEAAKETLFAFAADKKHWRIHGIYCPTAHLGQNLSLHPHLHCIVPGGGIAKMDNGKQPVVKVIFCFQ
ncbi:MAG: transposase [Bacteroidetes bacterium]|nr:transposase [Bacteroidota bacterium]